MRERSALLEEIEQRLRRLSAERLRVVSDFLAYLEEWEASEVTQELLQIPDFEQAFREATKQVEQGQVVRFLDTRYELLLTHVARSFYQRADPALVRRLNRCFQHLGENPYEHRNIKKLKGPLEGYFRYRIGDCG